MPLFDAVFSPIYGVLKHLKGGMFLLEFPVERFVVAK
jgi:hypothetical protein